MDGKPSNALRSHHLNFLLNNRTNFRYWIETSSRKSRRRRSSSPLGSRIRTPWLSDAAAAVTHSDKDQEGQGQGLSPKLEGISQRERHCDCPGLPREFELFTNS